MLDNRCRYHGEEPSIAWEVASDGISLINPRDISHDKDGDLITHHDGDYTQWEGSSYVVNWNYQWLAYKAGWIQGKKLGWFQQRHKYPLHMELQRQGYEDAINDIYDINDSYNN